MYDFNIKDKMNNEAIQDAFFLKEFKVEVAKNKKEYANVLGYVKLKEYDPMTNSLYRNRKQIYNEKYNVIKGK